MGFTVCQIFMIYHGIPIFVAESVPNSKNSYVNIPDEKKIDCFPIGRYLWTLKCWILDLSNMALFFYLGNADEKACLLRGCCWHPSTINVPGCFFPSPEPKCANISNEKKIDCFPIGINMDCVDIIIFYYPFSIL